MYDSSLVVVQCQMAPLAPQTDGPGMDPKLQAINCKWNKKVNQEVKDRAGPQVRFSGPSYDSYDSSMRILGTIASCQEILLDYVLNQLAGDFICYNNGKGRRPRQVYNDPKSSTAHDVRKH